MKYLEDILSIIIYQANNTAIHITIISPVVNRIYLEINTDIYYDIHRAIL